MLISILHPSRSRPQQAAATAKAWLSSAKYRDSERSDVSIEYILSLDIDDKIHHYDSIFSDFSSLGADFKTVVNANKNAIEAINRAAAICTGDLIIQIAEDFSTPPFHWDEYLINELSGKCDFVVKTQDGIQKTLVTLPIMDRVFYERYGYIYHPEYQHMFCDQELTAVAHMTGKIIELPLVIPHNHYSTGKTVKDEVNVKADSTYGTGAQIFERRKSRNFDIPNEQIVKQYKDIVWH